MKDKNFIVIQGWMINKLNLKGNKLIVFAIIYGFSQDCETKFNGSLEYIMQTINGSKNTVLKAIQDLEELSLIIKEKITIKGVERNEYYHNELVVQKLNGYEISGSETEHPTRSENEPLTGSETEHNNISSLKDIIKDNMTLFPSDEIESIPKKAIKLLNEKKDSKKPFEFTSTNLGFVEARIKEGFKFEDFKAVIDFKISEWSKNDKMKKYIRPETLFGTKFNRYLVEASEGTTSNNDGSNNFKYEPKEKAEML